LCVTIDTLSLQHRLASATQDNSNLPSVPSSNAGGVGAPASQAIRAAVEEQAQGGTGDYQPMGQLEGDELDRELADAEFVGDDGFESEGDMLDKMSRSPSIADGGNPRSAATLVLSY
jgi:hypothetical protein